MNGVVQRLTDHAATQETQRSNALLDSKDEMEKRREVVSYHMKPIVKVARALRGVVPGISVLKLPKGNIPTPQVINAATAMVQKADIYKNVLVENGLPANFLEWHRGTLDRCSCALDLSDRSPTVAERREALPDPGSTRSDDRNSRFDPR